MGHHTSRESLALRWAELCDDTSLHDFPYKIELNMYGVMEMSPASNRHGRFQAAIAHSLASQLPQGVVLTECSIFTDEGIRLPDVAWASADFMARHGDTTPFPQAPEICVEVRSRSNTNAEMEMKTRAYLAAGAIEVWIVTEAGEVQVFDADGSRPSSRFGVTLHLTSPRSDPPQET